MSSVPTDLGIVVIGRNEGDRLRTCLRSVLSPAGTVVYVDSGSTDGSVELARRMGGDVVNLDTSIPFTAARARNAGFRRLRELQPATELVQFVDGDCEVAAGWWDAARQHLREQAETAIVAGRTRERFPERSIYNRLCDIEWDAPAGAATECGGNMLVRANAFERVGGFDSSLVAGEEPELCVRLRMAGWRIWRLEADMVRHDADMARLGQWWVRTARSGHAFAEAAALHGRGPFRHGVRQSCSIWLWGAVVPVSALGLAWPTGGWSLLLLAGYLVLAARIFRHYHRRRGSVFDAGLMALFIVLGKLPQLCGQFTFLRRRITSRPPQLFECQPAADPSGTIGRRSETNENQMEAGFAP